MILFKEYLTLGSGNDIIFLQAVRIKIYICNCCFTNWPLYMEGKEKPNKEGGHSILVSDRFNEQENLGGLF